jgi:MscS family membrane protein
MHRPFRPRVDAMRILRPVAAALLLILAALAAPLQAQEPAKTALVQDATKGDAKDEVKDDARDGSKEGRGDDSGEGSTRDDAPDGPPDAWQRGTPRGAVVGFLRAGRERRWDDAAAALDLSTVPAGEREARGPELARQLKFVLDQELWIDVDALSDEPEGRRDDGLPAARELVGTLERQQSGRGVYLERGPREDGVPVWRFSAATVAGIPVLWEQHGPPAIIERLSPVLFETRFLQLALWQWIGLILLVIAAWLVAWLLASAVVRMLHPLATRSRTDLDDRLLRLVIGPVRLLASVAVVNATLGLLRLSVAAGTFAREASKFLVIAGVAWLAWRLVDLLASLSRARLEKRGKEGAANLVPLGARAVKIAVLVIATLAALGTFGLDLTAVLAGLGIGGLAVALAAQKTVENVFGGVSVLVDQPIRPGDFCRFGDRTGTVEDIGLRSTRIRTPDRTVVSVPNAEFSTLQIENFEKRDSIRFQAAVPLRHGTTPDQLRGLIATVREMLDGHPRVQPEPRHVRLVAVSVASIDIEVLAHVDTTEQEDFLAVREELLLRIMDLVAASGAGFGPALPPPPATQPPAARPETAASTSATDRRQPARERGQASRAESGWRQAES